MQYLIAFCSRPETASDVIPGAFVGLAIPDKAVRCLDRRLNRSREIPREAVGGGIFDGFFRDDFRPEVVSDVISDVATEHVGVDVPVKLCGEPTNLIDSYGWHKAESPFRRFV